MLKALIAHLRSGAEQGEIRYFVLTCVVIDNFQLISGCNT